jgi:hypothetical protein
MAETASKMNVNGVNGVIMTSAEESGNMNWRKASKNVK